MLRHGACPLSCGASVGSLIKGPSIKGGHRAKNMFWQVSTDLSTEPVPIYQIPFQDCFVKGNLLGNTRLQFSNIGKKCADFLQQIEL